MNYGRHMVALPTGKTINPTAPESAYYFDPSATLHVIKIDGKLRAFTTFGSLMSVGDCEEFKHDQTCRWMGMARCVSTRHPDGTVEGEPLPNRKIPHWVAK